MNKHKEYLERALDLAKKSALEGTGPFGCIITKDDKIIAEGHNQVTELNDPTAHAEVQAIRAACKSLESHQLTGCTVYTSCMPCPQCLGALFWARPEQVFYVNTAEQASDIGFDDALIYDVIRGNISSDVFTLEKISVNDELRAFDAWQNNPNKKLY
jgi:tRNA(Arg) A34 adenosine deaminase TadA